MPIAVSVDLIGIIDGVTANTIELLTWLGARPRTYSEAIEAWHSHCPRLTIWEDAVDRGYVARQPTAEGLRVTVTEGGEKFLREHGRSH
jgi:hypothetical protein